MPLKRSGAISSFGIVVGVFVTFAGGAPFAPRALAETAPTAAPQTTQDIPDPAPTQWIKTDPKNAKVCQITEDYALTGSPSPISSVSLQTSLDPDKFGLGIQVPLGFLFQKGIPLSVDGTEKATAQFITCLPSPQSQTFFCLAQALVDGAFVDSLKKGKALQLLLAAPDKTSTRLVFPLATFAQAYDGPDQAALARQRDDAAKVLAEKAKERAKQLEGQQGK
jgi:invasion protein IalB